MSRFVLRPWLPEAALAQLFGDRKRFGRVPQRDDPDWLEWERLMPAAYDATQRQSIGRFVNDAGYQIMREVNLDGLRVLEIGPGELPHIDWWQGRPHKFTMVDTRRDMLDRSAAKLRGRGIAHASVIVPRGSDLPFLAGSFDVVLSFYSLEHLDPLANYLDEIDRVLRPGGLLAGAIPCEGGVAWGAGRLVTSRQWFRRNTHIEQGKIISWEHPNFADEILDALDHRFTRTSLHLWPLRLPAIDVNLVARFVYEKTGA